MAREREVVVGRVGRVLRTPGGSGGETLHAKIYVADQRYALVGSANVSDAALGVASRANREVLVLVQPLPTTFFALLRRIQREAVEASEEFRRAIEAAAAEVETGSGA